MLRQARRHLPFGWRVISHLLHPSLIDSLLTSLERSLARSTTLLGAAILTLVVGGFAASVALIFNYRIISFSFLAAVFGAGFILGLIYQYLHQLGRRS